MEIWAEVIFNSGEPDEGKLVSAIEVPVTVFDTHSLSILVKNSGDYEIETNARDDIEIHLFDSNEHMVGVFDCEEVDPYLAHVSIPTLPEGTYRYEVFRKANSSEGVFFDEYWGSGSVALYQNISEEFERSFPTILDVYPTQIQGSSQEVTPYVDVLGGDMDCNVKATLKFSSTSNFQLPDREMVTSSQDVFGGQTARLMSLENIVVFQPTQVYALLEAEESGQWRVVDSWLWEEVLIPSHQLTLEIKNVDGNEIHENARDEIQINLYDGEWNLLAIHECVEVDNFTVRTVIPSVGEGSYRYEVYRKRNLEEGVYTDEFWGGGSVTIVEDTSQTFFRSMPWISQVFPEADTNSGIQTPYAVVHGGSTEGFLVRNTIRISQEIDHYWDYYDPDFQSISGSTSLGVDEEKRIDCPETVLVETPTNIHAELEYYNQEKEKWIVVDSYAWREINIPTYNLRIDVKNANNFAINSDARYDMQVNLYDENWNILGVYPCSVVDNYTVRVEIPDLEEGVYRFEVYREEDTGDWVYEDEFWGGGSVTVDADESVTFVRNMPMLSQVNPRGTVDSGEVVTPNAEVEGGISSYSVRATFRFSSSRNYAFPDSLRSSNSQTVSGGGWSDLYATQSISFTQNTYLHVELEAYVNGSWKLVDTWVWDDISIAKYNLRIDVKNANNFAINSDARYD
ncbi:MAG TPA: hypothetical protein PLF96_12685, partial [Thermotogota bacterium]|nr:hypothetical protein [Thermotogota bacterium]